MKSFNVFRRNNTTGDLKMTGSVRGTTRLDALIIS